MESEQNLSDLREWHDFDEVTSNLQELTKDKFLTGLKQWVTDRGIHFIRAHYRQYILKYIAERDPNFKPRSHTTDFQAACSMLIADLMYSMDLHLSLSVFTAEILPHQNKSPRLSAVHSRLEAFIGHPKVNDHPLSFQDVTFILDNFGIHAESETSFRIVCNYLNNKDPLLHHLVQRFFKVGTKSSRATKTCKLCENEERTNNWTNNRAKDDITNYIHRYRLEDDVDRAPLKTFRPNSNVFQKFESGQRRQTTAVRTGGGELDSTSRVRKTRLKNTGSNTTFKCQCSIGVQMSHKSSNTRIPASRDAGYNTQSVETLSAAVQTDREFKDAEVNTIVKTNSNQASTQTEHHKDQDYECAHETKGVDQQLSDTPSNVYIERLSRNYEEKLELMSTVEKLRTRLDEVTNRNEELRNELSLLRRRLDGGGEPRLSPQDGSGEEFRVVESTQSLLPRSSSSTVGRITTTRSFGSQTRAVGRMESIGNSLRFISESIACLKNEGKIIDALYKK